MNLQSRRPSYLKLMLELGKFRIAQLVTFSTATGYVLASGNIDLPLLFPVVGVFFLAMGAGALNQIQERQRDSLMPRTARRPIPAGHVSLRGAWLVTLLYLFTGTLILAYFTNPAALVLGWLTVLWYNGVYTYLKRWSALAVVPGSVIGSLPPMIGWAAAGSNIWDTRAISIAFFFFIWQIPHFWLLLLNFGQDYEKAGYPTLTALMSRAQLGRLTFIWIVATAAALVMVPLFGVGQSIVTHVLLFAASLGLVWQSLSLLRTENERFSFYPAFKGINIFILFAMFVLTLDRLITAG
ncbi:MAG: protoheme IX farnesyltransferase [Calditrichia bacterium]